MNPLLLFSVIFAILTAAVGAAYTTGALDPVIGEIAKYMFKAKAEAEVTALKAQGLSEGQDFLREEVSGSQQAADIGDKFGL